MQVEALGEPREQVERHDHEVLVRRVELVLVLLVGQVLVEGLLDEGDAAAVDGLAVGHEALLQRRGDGGEALEEGEQVLVLVLQHVPLGDERGHQQLDVLGLV